VNGASYPPPIASGERPQAPGAIAAIVLGILSVILLPLLGPVAWAIGRRAEQAADAAGGELEGRGLATAGKVLGMIGTSLLVLLVVVLVVLLATGVDGGAGGGSTIEA
jgi:hypothetical protein